MNRQLFRCVEAALLGLALAALLLWLGAAAPARASSDVHCVNQTGTGCDAVCGGGCYASVQAAVDAASPGHEIRIAAGTYAPGGTVAVITKELALRGGYDSTCAGFDPDLYHTILDAQWGGSVVSISNAGDMQLMHLTLTHGDGSGNCGSGGGCGGGIYATDTNLHVFGCVITNNVASSQSGDAMGMGGGIYADTGTTGFVEIHDSRIVSNTANTNASSIYSSEGGGVFVQHATTLLQENEILDNASSAAGVGGMGGGIFLYGVTQANVLTNTIRGNEATAHNFGGDGGGICIFFGSKAYVSGNLIEDNWTAPNASGYGGGVLVTGQSEVHLTRNKIIGNAAAPPNTGAVASGGGVCISSSAPVTLSNNLIARNTTSVYGDGGGVYVDHAAPAAPVLLVNNTIADNTNSGIAVYRYANLTLTNNIIAGHTVGITNTHPASSTVSADTNVFWNVSDPIVGSNAILQDPLLTADYHLGAGSPAVDAGLPIPWLTDDLDGDFRPQGSGYDVGADEYVCRVYLPLVLRSYQ